MSQADQIRPIFFLSPGVSDVFDEKAETIYAELPESTQRDKVLEYGHRIGYRIVRFTRDEEFGLFLAQLEKITHQRQEKAISQAKLAGSTYVLLWQVVAMHGCAEALWRVVLKMAPTQIDAQQRVTGGKA
jgi:hypothetical protein